jgi:hypothetical protein
MENELLPAAKDLLERNRKLNNLSEDDFRWLHAGCGLEEKVEVINSQENDPASGDPRPIFVIKLHCLVHGVTSSIVDQVQGV